MRMAWLHFQANALVLAEGRTMALASMVVAVALVAMQWNSLRCTDMWSYRTSLRIRAVGWNR